VVEGARLESVYSGNAIAGSNPALSANKKNCPRKRALLFSRATEISYFRFEEIKKAANIEYIGFLNFKLPINTSF
jgi:hypothetical protein